MSSRLLSTHELALLERDFHAKFFHSMQARQFSAAEVIKRVKLAEENQVDTEVLVVYITDDWNELDRAARAVKVLFPKLEDPLASPVSSGQKTIGFIKIAGVGVIPAKFQ